MLSTMALVTQPLHFIRPVVVWMVALNLWVAADFAGYALNPAKPLVTAR